MFGARFWGDGGGAAPVAVATQMVSLVRLEVWSTYQCAGGVREAFIPLSEAETLTTVERVQHDDEGLLVLSKESAAASSIDTDSVIRFLFSDGSFTEWPVWTIDDSSRESRVMRVTLRSVLTTLDTGAAVLSETISGVTTVDLEWKALTPTEIVSKILTFAPTYWTAGTVTPTIPVDLEPSGWMPLRAFRELVTAVRSQAVSCELHYRRNGTAGYFIDVVTTIGSAEPDLDVRTAKNLLGTSRRRDREKYAVDVVPLGSGDPRGTIARAYWEVTAKSTNVLTMQQPVTGGQMIGFDDQLNTSCYMVDDTGTAQQITDCVGGATQTVTVASGTNFTVGRWYRVVADSSGNELIHLRKSFATAGPLRPVESSTIDGTTNLQANPAMRVWTGSASDAPDGWTNSGLTIARTTTSGLWLFGGKSARCSAASSGQLFSPNLSIYIPSWVTAITGSVWAKAVALGNQSFVSLQYDSADLGAVATGIATCSTTEFQRFDITRTTGFTTGGVHAFRMRILLQGVSAPDYYIDAVQITFAGAASAFAEGSNPAKLWALGNQYLSSYSTAPTSYGVTFADLGQWDPNGFPYDTVALGQTANVRDTDLGVTTAGRIIELRRDWKQPLRSHLTITSRPEEFVSLLTGIAA